MPEEGCLNQRNRSTSTPALSQGVRQHPQMSRTTPKEYNRPKVQITDLPLSSKQLKLIYTKPRHNLPVYCKSVFSNNASRPPRPCASLARKFKQFFGEHFVPQNKFAQCNGYRSCSHIIRYLLQTRTTQTGTNITPQGSSKGLGDPIGICVQSLWENLMYRGNGKNKRWLHRDGIFTSRRETRSVYTESKIT